LKKKKKEIEQGKQKAIAGKDLPQELQNHKIVRSWTTYKVDSLYTFSLKINGRLFLLTVNLRTKMKSEN
jgi:hypothetical protein